MTNMILVIPEVGTSASRLQTSHVSRHYCDINYIFIDYVSHTGVKIPTTICFYVHFTKQLLRMST